MTRGAKANELKRLVAALKIPETSEAGTYEAVQISRGSRYRVGIDNKGDPVLLVATSGIEEPAALLDFEGRHLRISHCVRCSITVAGVEVERTVFSVIACIEADDLLKERFFDAIETLLRSLGETPTSEEFRQCVAGLVELFRLATQPPRGTIQGLWAELWTIAQGRDPRVLLDSWHAEPTDVYDFNCGGERLEVKSAGQRLRRHHFAHRQLAPPAGTRIAVCSIFVESSGGGTTISDLIQRIRRRVADPNALRRLDRVVAGTLGSEWRRSVTSAFDSELALESVRFYRVEDIPSLVSAIPPGLSDIRYVSDLTRSRALSYEDLIGLGNLFAAAAPEDP